MTGTVRLVFTVFVAPPRMGIRSSPPWDRIARAALIAHLGGQFADAMLVQQMAQRAHGHLQRTRGVCLASVGALQSFEHVSLFQLIEVRRQVHSVARYFKLTANPRRLAIGDFRW